MTTEQPQPTNETACGASLSDAELGRSSFEAWAEMQAYFGYEEGDQLLLERDGEGYTDSCVHAAWMGYLLGSDTKRGA
jgi:hypothetical protein